MGGDHSMDFIKRLIAALIPALAIVLLMYTIAGTATRPKYTVLDSYPDVGCYVYMVQEIE